MRRFQRKGMWVGLLGSVILHVLFLISLPIHPLQSMSESNGRIFSVSLQDTLPFEHTRLKPSSPSKPASTLPVPEITSAIIHGSKAKSEPIHHRLSKPMPSLHQTEPEKIFLARPETAHHHIEKRQPPPVSISDPGHPSKGRDGLVKIAGSVSQPEPSSRPDSNRSLQHALIQALQPYFHYPKLAQRRNWQGTVILSVHIDSSGHFKQIQIDQSSGHLILDRSAKRSLQRLAVLPDISRWLGQKTGLKTQLPIRYQLTEG
ncbi:MAG: energy transducer TonB [Gammaproteobacteria bacterium]|nr:MAG: energy transducer TonB [Gammaproteobacteria bacterium]